MWLWLRWSLQQQVQYRLNTSVSLNICYSWRDVNGSFRYKKNILSNSVNREVRLSVIQFVPEQRPQWECLLVTVCYSRCMMENGQCDCRRHLIGRQCSEVQPGYFCAPLDYYKYEAEDATGHSSSDSALPVSTPLWFSVAHQFTFQVAIIQTCHRPLSKDGKWLRWCGVVATRHWGEGEI